ncbi:MAG: hypothetical protein IKO72_07820 [Kiritimatiellae bacterium]|nr:hypothetical protein [Kiritimatiellia bacterium]
MDAAANQIGVYQPNETVQGRSGRPCHIAGRFALLAVIAFAAGAVMGSGRIDLEESYMQARLTASGELYVTYKLGYDTSSTATTVDSRDFDFNISYGIVGGADTYTATMSSSGTLLPAGAGSSYQVWYIAGDGGTAPGYTSPAIPGLQSGDEVWYQVCVSNTLHNGSAPTGENDMTTTMAVHYASAAYRDVGCVFSQTPWQYNITGAATPGFGYVSARLTYAHNTSTLGVGASTITSEFEADGAFSFGIPAVANGANAMTMTWKVELLDGNGDPLLCKDYLGDSVHTETIVDTGRVTYTWTGDGDGRSWDDGNNWTQNVDSCLGYPGVKNTSYWDQIMFNTDADVDLGGKTYGICDGGGNLIFGTGINVTLRNGLLDLNASSYTLGGNGTTLTFDRFAVIRGTVSDGQYPTVDFAAGTTMKFVGTSTSDMNWKPTQNNVKFIFQDGTIKTRYSTDSTICNQNASRTLITNAIWQTTAGNVSKGTAFITTFLDGPDRQAQFVCSAAIDLCRYYVIRIPRDGHSDATIKASTLSSDTNVGTFIVYVDDYLDDAPVPLVKFTTTNSTNKDNNNTRMTTQLNNAKITLVARTGDTATPLEDTSYEDVTAKRNGRLVWDNTEQILYYRQDRVKEVVDIDGNPIPVDWLLGYSSLSNRVAQIDPALGGDQRRAAIETILRDSAANGRFKIWQCHVVNIDPTDANATFRADITMENGVPRISWFPNFEDDPLTPRLYKVKFVDSLEDAAASNWCDYVQGEVGEASARFFKVEVRLPPAEQ